MMMSLDGRLVPGTASVHVRVTHEKERLSARALGGWAGEERRRALHERGQGREAGPHVSQRAERAEREARRRGVGRGMASQWSDGLDMLEWRQARQWLISSGVIPPTHRVTKPDIDLVDFARSLRDGVFLCQLLLALKPGCLSDADWTPRPQMQYTFLKNIAAFLIACKKEFRIADGDLFNESDLYDVDNFRKVMHLLSSLSHTTEALEQHLKPFPRVEVGAPVSKVNNDEIYASLQDIAMTTERLYANVEDLYPEMPASKDDDYAESIYDSICYYQPPPVKVPSEGDDKKSNLLKELCETEKNFVAGLKIICQDFYVCLGDHISADDSDLLFSIARSLYPIHCDLLEGFEHLVDPKLEADITKLFHEHKDGLLQYGMYAARLPQAVEKAKLFQSRGETARLMATCQEKSQQRFPLSDLLNVPIQRVLKYPLLMKELHKCAKKVSMPSLSECSALERLISSLQDIAHYINQTKGDCEKMRMITEVEQSLSDYHGPQLLESGRYHLDGELRCKPREGGGVPKTRWAFLFDKVMLLCKKGNKFKFDVKYIPKEVYPVADLQVKTVPSAHRGRQFSYAFSLIVQNQSAASPQPGTTTELLLYAKTEELKSQWIDAINHAREISLPRDGKRTGHALELCTFDMPCVCGVCSKLLHGCYFQGYLCSACKTQVHRDCLKDLDRCSFARPASGSARTSVTSLTWSRDNPPVQQRTRERRGQIYVAIMKYDAIGTRRDRVLSFEKAEELEVFNAAPNTEWWEAVSCLTGSRGEVPANYLVKKSTQDEALRRSTITEERLRDYPWFLGKKSRIEAEQALHGMKDGVFLIRESDVRPGEYAIALKWSKLPKHIKISKHPDTSRFFVSDVCEFLSVEELVDYYQKNSLGSSFPGVDTTLRYPHKEMVEATRTRSTSSASAPDRWADVLFTFVAVYPDELTIEKYDRVNIIKKDTNKLGWWFGECNGKTGLFPSNYVRETPPS